MIQHIPHSNIDFDKYNACVQNSLETLLYAESWFLQIEAKDNWDILMMNDYQYVMPITNFRLKRSFWKKSLITPYHAQQLGIVSTAALNSKVHDAFLHKLLSLKPLEYSFNHTHNTFLANQKFSFKNNYVLNLNKPYEELFQNFSSSKRSRVRKAKKNNLVITETDNIDSFIKFQKAHMPWKESSSVFNKKKAIIQYALKNDIGKLYNVKSNKHVIAAAFFIFYRDRIYYLQSVSNEEGRKLHGTNFMLNHVIQENANQNVILDFEGSQISGVVKFIESFAAINQPYYSYSA